MTELRSTDSYSHFTDTADLDDCFLHYPKFDPQGRHLFHFETIAEYEMKDSRLREALKSDPALGIRRLGKADVICRTTKTISEGDAWNIVVTDEMLKNLIRWYHHATCCSDLLICAKKTMYLATISARGYSHASSSFLKIERQEQRRFEPLCLSRQ
jgi:hypothetical protein